MRRTVAVTGATGFIGGHLVRRLAEGGWHVRILTRRLPVHPQFAETPVEAVIGALDDAESLRQLVRGTDAVVHLAGLVKAGSRAAFFAANAAGVRSVATAATASGTRPRFVLLSSLAARAPHLSDYAASKRAGEAALAEVAELPWTILRPPAVYGPGDREILALFRWVARGFALLPDSGRGRLSLLHVDDLAAAIVAALESPGDSGATHELDDGRIEGYSWDEVIETAAAHFGTRVRRVPVPRRVLQAVGLANVLAAVLTGRPRMLTHQKARELCHSDWVCRDRSFVERTGWRPVFPLDLGFGQTIAWYRAQGWL